jgi:hypothetical protein
LGRKRSRERETHNFKSTDSTIDKDPKLTLQVSSPRAAAPAVKHEAEEDWSTRQKTIARGRAVTPARRVPTKGRPKPP